VGTHLFSTTTARSDEGKKKRNPMGAASKIPPKEEDLEDVRRHL